ncbi:KilA-N domain-containing protein [Methylocystis iwaonis]|nr:KilA-N domain-containing protein [Methylocystis iwaonis]
MTDNKLDFFKVKGRKIAVDGKGRIRLDDIHKAGGFTRQTPYEWGRLATTLSLITFTAEKNTGKSRLLSKDDLLSVFCARRGNLGGVWAHPNLALAYAKYLSPSLHYEVNEVFLRYKAGDATLADEILQHAPAKDNEWAGVRALGRAKRIDLTATLKEHDVTKPLEFARVTNGTYKGLLGKTAKQLRAEKGLSKTASLRDAMNTRDLVFVMASEQLAKERIEDEDSRGVHQCEIAATKSAASIRSAIEADRADRSKRLV